MGTNEDPVYEGQTAATLTRGLCQHIIGMAPTAISDDEDKDNSLVHQSYLLDEDIKVGNLLEGWHPNCGFCQSRSWQGGIGKNYGRFIIYSETNFIILHNCTNNSYVRSFLSNYTQLLNPGYKYIICCELLCLLCSVWFSLLSGE